ncbi:MAG: protein-disulfide reductase DsbD family protein [Calditrichaceae bacterium]
MRIFIKQFVFNNLLFVFLFPILVFAQFNQESHVEARLISEVKTVQPGASFWVATRLQMNDGWHTYWRNPGDAGLETTIEWNLPEGFTAGKINWPYPYRISEPPLMAYGYHDTIYLLNKITVDQNVNTDRVVFLKADVNWLECANVCIPGHADLKLRLEVKNEPTEINKNYSQTFARARAKLPIESNGWDFHTAIEDSVLIIEGNAPSWVNPNPGEIHFYPYKTSFINNVSEQELLTEKDRLHLEVKLADMDPQIPDTIKGILVSEAGWRGPGTEKAMEIIIPLSDKLEHGGSSGSGVSSLWLAILFSFIGGVILNLMPCVLPVLSIKIMGFVNQAHEEHSKSWQHGAVFTLGVLISFWVLAAIILILKRFRRIIFERCNRYDSSYALYGAVYGTRPGIRINPARICIPAYLHFYRARYVCSLCAADVNSGIVKICSQTGAMDGINEAVYGIFTRCYGYLAVVGTWYPGRFKCGCTGAFCPAGYKHRGMDIRPVGTFGNAFKNKNSINCSCRSLDYKRQCVCLSKRG